MIPKRVRNNNAVSKSTIMLDAIYFCLKMREIIYQPPAQPRWIDATLGPTILKLNGDMFYDHALHWTVNEFMIVSFY